MVITKEEIAAYTTNLTAALTAFMNGDSGPIVAHKAKYGVMTHPNQTIERLSLLKAVTASTAIAMELRSKAKAELAAAGMSSWDDGDVP